MDNISIRELAVELTVEITEICDNIKGRSVFVNQILRSCSSIGANSAEAKYAQSKADFISKLQIALKECYETEYWIEIAQKAGLDGEYVKKMGLWMDVKCFFGTFLPVLRAEGVWEEDTEKKG